jgi:hypothetical protein
MSQSVKAPEKGMPKEEKVETKNDTLGLYGPEDSKYLRLVARRAAEVPKGEAERIQRGV